MENPVSLQDKVRNPPLRFFFVQRPEFFIAEKAATEKFRRVRLERQFFRQLSELVPGVVGPDDNHLKAFRLLPDLPAPGQKHPPFEPGRLQGPAELPPALVKGVEPQGSQFSDQFSQGPIGNEPHG